MNPWIYLALPIDRSKEDPDKTSQKAIEGLEKEGLQAGYYLPARAFNSASGADPGYLVKVNRTALEEADAMLVLYRPGVESWGVPMELLMAWAAGVPSYVLLPSETAEQELPAYLQHWATQIFSKIEDLAVALKAITPKGQAQK